MAITSVQELINKIVEKKIMNSKVNPTALEDFLIKELEFKTYLPFEEKQKLCEAVLDQSCIQQRGLIKTDSTIRYVLFTISIFSKYTCLEFENPLNDYDLLCKSNLINIIISLLGDEYGRCNEILNMTLADKINNNNNIENILNNALFHILNRADDIIDILSDRIEDMDMNFSQVDIDKITKFIDTLGKKS